MKKGRYLPSTQFSLILVSLLISGGLVYAAQGITSPHANNSIVINTQPQTTPSSQTDWASSLNDVQQSSGISLPAAPSQNAVDAALKAAQSSNVTATISRSLLVNLITAQQQGMGTDIPTQDQLINQALAQVPTTNQAAIATKSDLTVIEDSQKALHAYGNAIMNVFAKDSSQEYAKTMVVIDAVTTSNDSSKLDLLKPYKKTYALIAQHLLDVPVPSTLEPFHLELINDCEKIAASYDGMASLLSDPIVGLSALQQFTSLEHDASQMLINIAQTFSKNDILFTKDEPGATWSLILQSQQGQ